MVLLTAVPTANGSGRTAFQQAETDTISEKCHIRRFEMSKRSIVTGGAIALCMAGAIAAASVAVAHTAEDRPGIDITSPGNVRESICLAGVSSVLGEYLAQTAGNAEFVALSGEIASAGVNAEVVSRGIEGISAVPAVGADAMMATSVENMLQEEAMTMVSAGANAMVIGSAEGDEAEEVSVTFEDRGLQTAGNIQPPVDMKKEESVREKEQKESKEEKEWQDYLMADVKEYLNIRASKKSDAEVVGKLRKGDRALIKSRGKVWTKIESGQVEGYVKSEYCLTGKEALDYAKKVCGKVAVVEPDSLRVREERSRDSRVITTASRGDRLEVNAKAAKKKGWVAVKTASGKGFVSSEYVKVTYNTSKAISAEEEQKLKAAAEAEKAAAAAVSVTTEDKKESTEERENRDSRPKQKQGESVSASVDDKTLLAALIYCEAGGENYDCQLAVGAVVVNRVHSGSFPGSIRGVIYQRGQFGPASSGRLASALSGGVSSKSKRAAEEALSGVDNTDGCLFFNDVGRTNHRGLQIDSMRFW